MPTETGYTYCIMMKIAFALLVVFALAVPITASANLEITCSKKDNLQAPQPGGGDYVKTVTEAVLQEFPKAKVNCTSCYRDIEDQKRACRNACGGNENGCPGTCAPPGQSQHQKLEIATCDLSGLGDKGDVKKGCDFLFKLCKEKFEGRCGIGGYPGGSHHFGASTSAKPSAWNQCAFLKPKMGIETAMGEQTMDKLNSWWSRIMHRTRGGEDQFH